MKLLYILAAVMFAGLIMMTVSSYKVMSVVKENPPVSSSPVHGSTPAAPVNPDVLPYVTLSYLGLAFFLIGAVGAIFAAFKAMTHRF